MPPCLALLEITISSRGPNLPWIQRSRRFFLCRRSHISISPAVDIRATRRPKEFRSLACGPVPCLLRPKSISPDRGRELSLCGRHIPVSATAGKTETTRPRCSGLRLAASSWTVYTIWPEPRRGIQLMIYLGRNFFLCREHTSVFFLRR